MSKRRQTAAFATLAEATQDEAPLAEATQAEAPQAQAPQAQAPQDATPSPVGGEALERLGPQEKAAVFAYYAGANMALFLDAAINSGRWIGCDDAPDNPDADAVTPQIAGLAAFVRANPGVGGEACWRHAQGQGWHAGEAQGFAAARVCWRLAYEMFAAALPVADRLLAEEAARQAPPPAPPAPVTVERAATILEEVDDAYAPAAATPARVTLTQDRPAA